MTSGVRIVTSFRSPTSAALSSAAATLGHGVRCLDKLASEEALTSFAPTGALVFCYGFPDAALASIRRLKSLCIPVAVWQIDDPHYFRSPKLHDVTVRIARTCDLYHTHTHELDEEYRKVGVSARYLPIGARLSPRRAAWAESLPVESEFHSDLSFCGTLTDQRREALTELQRALPPSIKLDIFSAVPFAETFAVYRRSRINLSLGASYENAYPSEWALTERTWEAPMIGGLLLQPEKRDLHSHFEVGVDAVTYDDLDDCARKIVHHLAHPEERREIARRAQRKIFAEHLFAHRLQAIVRDLESVQLGRRAEHLAGVEIGGEHVRRARIARRDVPNDTAGASSPQRKAVRVLSIFDLPGFSHEIARALTDGFVQGEGSTLQNSASEIVSQTSFLMNLLRTIRPQRLLETGTHKGHFCYFARLAIPGATIDTFGIEPESQGCVNLLNERLGVFAAFRLGDSKITLSSFKPTYPIEFAWIDGGHDRETCFSDLQNCGRLAIPHVCVDDYGSIDDVRAAVDAFVADGSYRVANVNDDRRGICYLQRDGLASTPVVVTSH